MKDLKRCAECGVPRIIAKQHCWEDNGTITQADNPSYRLVYIEVDVLEKIFSHIQELLGMNIDRIIIEGKRKAALEYLLRMLAGFKGFIVRLLARRQAYEMIASLGIALGYGQFEVLGFKRGKDVRVFGRNIYFMPLMYGDLKGTFNAVEGVSAELHFEPKEDGYLITLQPGEEAVELASRIEHRKAPQKPDDLHFKRCPRCGVPLDIKMFSWDEKEGIISDTIHRKRIVVIDPEGVESVFRELESELGEDISQAIIDAQRLYTLHTIQTGTTQPDPQDIVMELALMGMGHLVECYTRDGVMEAVVENSPLPLLVAGKLQGLFELQASGGSVCEYRREADGTLVVTVRAR
jgi:hypothetical protein